MAANEMTLSRSF